MYISSFYQYHSFSNNCTNIILNVVNDIDGHPDWVLLISIINFKSTIAIDNSSYFYVQFASILIFWDWLNGLFADSFNITP